MLTLYLIALTLPSAAMELGLQVAASLMVAAVVGGLPTVALFIHRRIKNATIASLLAVVSSLVARCVAAAAEEVRNRKDPAKPWAGSWGPEEQRELLGRVAARVLAIGGAQVQLLWRLLGRGLSLSDFVRELVEAEVESARRAGLGDVKLAASTVNVNAAPGSSVPAPIAPVAPSKVPAASQVLPVLVLALLGLLGGALEGCTNSQHDPAVYGVVKVWTDPRWLPYDQTRIAQALVNLDALGPDFVAHPDRATADVLVLPFESPSCQRVAARYFVGTRVVEVDPVCMTGDTAFRTAVGHEIGHAVGMTHVCEHPQDAEDGADCSPVGFGPAMMGPRLRQSDDGPGWGEVYSGTLGFENPTDLDLAEYRRTHPVRALAPAAGRDGGAR